MKRYWMRVRERFDTWEFTQWWFENIRATDLTHRFWSAVIFSDWFLNSFIHWRVLPVYRKGRWDHGWAKV